MHKVLLVDDEVFARKGLRNLINWEEEGYEVVDEANNGKEALAMIESIKPALVVTDIRMPVLDGLELIKAVKDEAGEHSPSFIIISGYNDFKYAQQAVRYGVHDFILKPIDEEVLKETLSHLKDKLKKEERSQSLRDQQLYNEIFTSLIKGEFKEDLVQDGAEKLGLKPGTSFRYMLVEWNDVHPWRQPPVKLNTVEIKGVLVQTIRDILKLDKEVYVYEHRNRYGFICSQADLKQYQGSVEGFAEELQRALSFRVKTPFYIYAGIQASELSKMKESYMSAKEALLYKYVDPKKRTVFHERLKGISLQYIGMDSGLYQKLISAVEEHEETKYMDAISMMFADFSEKRYAPEAVKLSIHQCVSGFLGILRRMGKESTELTHLEPIISWQDINLTLEELKRLFTACVSEISQTIGDCRKDMNKGSIHKVKEYIEQHYQENISLKSIAANFFWNPVYLGHLFKKTYGTYFNDFLLQLRLDEAKKLLRQTDMRVYEVAEQVGFNNADYFVRQFEKVEGITPTEYRSKLLKG